MTFLPKKLLKQKKKETPWKTLFSSNWLFTIYLALVSIVSVIVLCINLGIMISSLWNYLLITDEEYILSDRAWEINQCSEPRFNKEDMIEKTPEEITQCEEKATVSAIARRSIDLKETFISSLSWFLVFGLLFCFHYPKFLATREEK